MEVNGPRVRSPRWRRTRRGRSAGSRTLTAPNRSPKRLASDIARLFLPHIAPVPLPLTSCRRRPGPSMRLSRSRRAHSAAASVNPPLLFPRTLRSQLTGSCELSSSISCAHGHGHPCLCRIRLLALSLHLVHHHPLRSVPPVHQARALCVQGPARGGSAADSVRSLDKQATMSAGHGVTWPSWFRHASGTWPRSSACTV